MQASKFVPVPNQDKLGGLWQEGHPAYKWEDDGGLLINPSGVATIQMVSVSASVIFPCTIKSRRRFMAPAHTGSSGKRAVKRLCESSA